AVLVENLSARTPYKGRDERLGVISLAAQRIGKTPSIAGGQRLRHLSHFRPTFWRLQPLLREQVRAIKQGEYVCRDGENHLLAVSDCAIPIEEVIACGLVPIRQIVVQRLER